MFLSFLNRQLDREKVAVYRFQVVAADSGRYKSRSQTADVQITIEDVNDNKPQFAKYAYSVQVSPSAAIGTEIAKISATDADTGPNAELVYKLLNDDQHQHQNAPRFRINANSGSVTLIGSLASDAGRTFYLEASATDKGSPSALSSNCIIEVKIDGAANYDSGNRVALRFHNATYVAHIAENAPDGEQVVQVSVLNSCWIFGLAFESPPLPQKQTNVLLFDHRVSELLLVIRNTWSSMEQH